MTSPESAKPPKRRPKGRGAGYAIGAFIVEIDQRLLRNLPPVEQLVARGDPIRGQSGEAGAFDLGPITVVFPPSSSDGPAPVTARAAETDPWPGPAEGEQP